MTFRCCFQSGRLAWMAICIALSLLVLSSVAQAETDLIDSVEYLEDPTGRLTIADLQDARFQPVGQSFLAGFTPSTFWFRLRLRDLSAAGPAVLMVRPVMLDHVTLYQPKGAEVGEWRAQRIGGLRSLAMAGRSAALWGFALDPDLPAGAYLYLQVATSGSLSLYLEAKPALEAQREVFLADLLRMSYLACMLVVLLWSGRMALMTRDSLFWRFAALQVIWILHNMFFFGYAMLILTAMPMDALFITYRGLVILVTALTILFHRAVLQPFHPHWAAGRLMDLQLLVIVLAGLIFAGGNVWLALRINGVAIAVTPFVLLANVFTARTSAPPGLMTMRVIYLVLCASLLSWVLALLGLVHVTSMALYGTMFHGLSTALLMSAILHLQGRNILNAKREAQAALAAMVQKRAADIEQIHMLVRFFDMLTHETKNALGVISMSVAAPSFGDRQRARVDESISSLSRLVDRCMETVRMEADEVTIRPEACDLAAILRSTLAAAPEAGRVRLTTPEAVPLHSDPVILGVILSNLLDNALKYSAPQSAVTVTLKTQAWSHHIITFENQAGAAGMPDETQLFQRFYRNLRALGQSGSGLGLYLVRSLIRQVGGDIHYRPEAGIVRFQLVLPC